MVSIAHWVSGVIGGVWAFMWAGTPRWIIELLDSGGKSASVEHQNWSSTGWEFQLLHVSIAHWVSGVIIGTWGFIRGGGLP